MRLYPQNGNLRDFYDRGAFIRREILEKVEIKYMKKIIVNSFLYNLICRPLE